MLIRSRVVVSNFSRNLITMLREHQILATLSSKSPLLNGNILLNTCPTPSRQPSTDTEKGLASLELNTQNGLFDTTIEQRSQQRGVLSPTSSNHDARSTAAATYPKDNANTAITASPS